jgi:hypothetical protein
VRLGVVQGEYHWPKHDKDNESGYPEFFWTEISSCNCGCITEADSHESHIDEEIRAWSISIGNAHFYVSLI